MKRSIYTLLLCTILSVTVSAFAQDRGDVEKGVQALAAQHRKAWDTRDINLLMDCFGPPEGLLIAGGTIYKDLDTMKGRALEIWSDRTAESWRNERVHVIVLDANTALMQIVFSGRYTRTSGVTWEYNSSASFTSLVRRFGDKWKIVAHSNAASGKQVGKK
jgi:hypothetical protein